MSSQLKLLQQYDRIIGGLQILAKYGEQSTSAEHDVIYAGPCNVVDIVSSDDADLLELHGWSWHEDASSWGFFT